MKVAQVETAELHQSPPAMKQTIPDVLLGESFKFENRFYCLIMVESLGLKEIKATKSFVFDFKRNRISYHAVTFMCNGWS